MHTPEDKMPTYAHYKESISAFTETYLEESPGEQIDMEEFTQRFTSWYQANVDRQPPNRVWIGRVLAELDEPTGRDDRTKVLVDRTWTSSSDATGWN